jgi:hypothetical protein
MAIGAAVGLLLTVMVFSKSRSRAKTTGYESHGGFGWMPMASSDSGGSDCSPGDAGCDAGGGDGAG